MRYFMLNGSLHEFPRSFEPNLPPDAVEVTALEADAFKDSPERQAAVAAEMARAKAAALIVTLGGRERVLLDLLDSNPATLASLRAKLALERGRP